CGICWITSDRSFLLLATRIENDDSSWGKISDVLKSLRTPEEVSKMQKSILLPQLYYIFNQYSL
ncbi:MAG: hypothetical protein ACFFCU_18645, partial [Promethearchaeota archaeon]